jgi:hypothetical protein
VQRRIRCEAVRERADDDPAARTDDCGTGVHASRFPDGGRLPADAAPSDVRLPHRGDEPSLDLGVAVRVSSTTVRSNCGAPESGQKAASGDNKAAATTKHVRVGLCLATLVLVASFATALMRETPDYVIAALVVCAFVAAAVGVFLNLRLDTAHSEALRDPLTGLPNRRCWTTASSRRSGDHADRASRSR